MSDCELTDGLKLEQSILETAGVDVVQMTRGQNEFLRAYSRGYREQPLKKGLWAAAL